MSAKVMKKKVRVKHWVKTAVVKKVAYKKKGSKTMDIRKLASSAQYVLRFSVTSHSSGNRYTVAMRSFGTWHCSCMGGIRHGDCKHMRFVALKPENIKKTNNARKKSGF